MGKEHAAIQTSNVAELDFASIDLDSHSDPIPPINAMNDGESEDIKDTTTSLSGKQKYTKFKRDADLLSHMSVSLSLSCSC